MSSKQLTSATSIVSSRNLTKLFTVLGMLAFALPFLMVSCGSNQIAQFSGFELMQGASRFYPTYVTGQTNVMSIPMQPLLVVGFACLAVTFVFSWLIYMPSSRAFWGLASFAGAGAILTYLLIAREQLSPLVADVIKGSYAKNYFQYVAVNFGSGIFIAFLMNVVSFLMFIRKMFFEEKDPYKTFIDESSVYKEIIEEMTEEELANYRTYKAQRAVAAEEKRLELSNASKIGKLSTGVPREESNSESVAEEVQPTEEILQEDFEESGDAYEEITAATAAEEEKLETEQVDIFTNEAETTRSYVDERNELDLANDIATEEQTYTNIVEDAATTDEVGEGIEQTTTQQPLETTIAEETFEDTRAVAEIPLAEEVSADDGALESVEDMMKILEATESVIAETQAEAERELTEEADALEEITENTAEIVQEETLVDAIGGEVQLATDVTGEELDPVDKLAKEIADKKDNLKHLTDLYIDGEIEKDIYDDGVENLKQQIAKDEKNLEDLKDGLINNQLAHIAINNVEEIATVGTGVAEAIVAEVDETAKESDFVKKRTRATIRLTLKLADY